MSVSCSISIRSMWGNDMGEIVGRAVSRQNALAILTESRQYIPDDRTPAYDAALNRVTYEFRRHQPVEPRISNGWMRCGSCGTDLKGTDVYCPNCGKEVKRV